MEGETEIKEVDSHNGMAICIVEHFPTPLFHEPSLMA